MQRSHKTVFFDLGNVLLFFSHEKMCKQIAALCQLNESAVRALLFSKLLSEQFEKGLSNSHSLHSMISSHAKIPIDFDALMEAISAIFEPNRALEPIVQTLKQRGVKLAILSNTIEPHFKYALAHYPILHLFDYYILSYEVGARKPEEKIFSHALSLTGAIKEECFYTDDVEDFVLAARRFRIDAEVFKGVETLKKQLEERGFLT